MQHQHSQTAILLFAQTAQVDAARKSLANTAVMDVLNKKTVQTVCKSGLDYYHFTEKEQRGNNFASRFVNSIQDVFDKGYQSIICLGNDTPLLTTELIHKAALALENGKAVKGRSMDGGLYLIGINSAQFDARGFENLPWQSSNLASSFDHYIKSVDSELIVLKCLQDIDSTADLHQFLAGKDARLTVIGLLLDTLLQKHKIYHHLERHILNVVQEQPQNKGSPILLAA